MRSRNDLAVAAVLGMLLAPAAAGAGVRDDNPNLVGGELLGRGVAITLNYERFLNNHFGLGGGLMAIGVSNSSVTVVPLYLSVAPGDVHSPYLSVGATFIGGGTFHDYESTWLTSASLGYQFQSRGGFFVRPFFTYLLPIERGSGDAYLLWPGLTIGGSF